jgi:hypothetical protein
VEDQNSIRKNIMATATKTQKIQTAIQFVRPANAGTPTKARNMIRSIVENAETNHGFICLTGYRSETGKQSNYVLQPYGANAYPRLVRESLEMLERQELVLPDEINDQFISKATWNEALLEQIASFRKTLDGGHDRKDNKEKIDKGFYENNGSVYIANVRIVKSHETAEQAEHNATLDQGKISKIPVSPKAKAKKWLRDNTPVSNFRGQFRLDEDKFDRIAFAGMVIEFADFGELFTG